MQQTPREEWLAMAEPNPLRRWLAPAAWSVGLLAVVLVGAIVSVKLLSDRDAITLAGGIAVFAISITAWFAATSAIWMRAIRAGRRDAADAPRLTPREVERPPLVNR
jgi:hypothetical protein